MWSPVLFGKRLGIARAERGKTLAELEVLTGISAGELSRLERGKRASVGLPQAVKICEALSIRLEWLVYNKGAMSDDEEPSGVRTTNVDRGASGKHGK